MSTHCICLSLFTLGYLSTLSASLSEVCVGDVCYLRPDTNGGNWTYAQRMCKSLNATLPIFHFDHSALQKSFEVAVYNLTNNDTRNAGIWLGARAMDYKKNWTWLDGSSYDGTVDELPSGDYIRSYAIASNTTNGVHVGASSANNSYSYICHHQGVCANATGPTAFNVENSCYVKHDERLPWFGARNVCLTNNGDLASFRNISSLEGIIGSNSVWIGLVKSRWIWQNAATEHSTDVTFTMWKTGQPDDSTPTCISTDDDVLNFPLWRDRSCSDSAKFLCQVVNTTVTTTEHTSKPSFVTFADSFSTGSSIASKMPARTHEDTGAVNIPLAVGIGVGIGVPVVIVVLVVIIVIMVRRKQRHGAVSWNSRFKKKHNSQNGHNNPEAETSQMDEMDEIDAGRTPSDNNSSAQYASIREATRSNQDSDPVPPPNQGTVYAPLGFNQAD